MSYSVIIYYTDAKGQSSSVGTNSTRVNTVISQIEAQGGKVTKVEAQGSGTNVTRETSRMPGSYVTPEHTVVIPTESFISPVEPQKTTENNTQLITEAITNIPLDRYYLRYRSPTGEIKGFQTTNPQAFLTGEKNIPGEFMSLITYSPTGEKTGYYTYTTGNQQIIFDVSKNVLSTPSLKEQFISSGYTVPSDVTLGDISDEREKKFFSLYPSYATIAKQIGYGKYVGADVSTQEKQLETQYNIWAQDKDILGNPIIPITLSAEQAWQSWHKKAMVENPVGTTARDISYSFLSIFDPGTWGAASANNLPGYIHSKDISNIQQIQAGQGWDVWKNVQTPAYEYVIIPMATFYAFNLAFPSLAGISKVGAPISKAGQYFVKGGTAFTMAGTSTAIGTGLGATAAFEKHGLVPPGSTVSYGVGLGMQIGSMGMGMYGAKIDYPAFSKIKTNMATAFYEKIPFTEQIIYGERGIQNFKTTGMERNQLFLKNFKTQYKESFYNLPGVKNIAPKIKTFLQEQTYMKDIKPVGSNWETTVLNKITGGIKSTGYYLKTNVLFDYELNPRNYISKNVTSIMDVGRIRTGGYPSYIPYESFYEYAPPRLETHLSNIIARNERIMKTSGLRQMKIETITQMFTIEGEPSASFISKLKNQNQFIIGQTNVATGELKGTLYWKLNPRDVFFQRTVITGRNYADYLGTKQEIDFFRTSGYTVPNKMVQLYGYWDVEIPVEQYRGINISRGINIQKDFFAGQGIPTKYGFKTNIGKIDYSFEISGGLFRSEGIQGRYMDIGKTFKFKPIGKEYYGGGSSGISDYKTVTPKLSDVFATHISGFDETTKMFSGDLSLISLKGDTSLLYGGRAKIRGYSLAEIEQMEYGINQTRTKPISRTSSIIKTASILGLNQSNILKQLNIPTLALGNIGLTQTKISSLNIGGTKNITTQLTRQTQDVMSLQKLGLISLTETTTVTTPITVPITIPVTTSITTPVTIPITPQINEPVIDTPFSPTIVSLPFLPQPTSIKNRYKKKKRPSMFDYNAYWRRLPPIMNWNLVKRFKI